jgi:hypothetical protein
LDFGNSWFGYPCSQSYWEEVLPIFNYLTQERIKHSKWSELQNKAGFIYAPLLNAFINELCRAYNEHDDIPVKMVEYLLGKFDFYKVVSIDYKRQTEIQPYNLHGELNRFKKVKPKVIIPKTSLPTRIVKIEMKPNSNNTVELYLDGGWQFSFRIHNASTFVETSLKFDIQIIGMPVSITEYTIRRTW